MGLSLIISTFEIISVVLGAGDEQGTESGFQHITSAETPTTSTSSLQVILYCQLW